MSIATEIVHAHPILNANTIVNKCAEDHWCDVDRDYTCQMKKSSGTSCGWRHQTIATKTDLEISHGGTVGIISAVVGVLIIISCCACVKSFSKEYHRRSQQLPPVVHYDGNRQVVSIDTVTNPCYNMPTYTNVVEALPPRYYSDPPPPYSALPIND
ncbi:unnamed protein product [Didymodactylos carnosus]|uniref:Uncharacterized protein n=1 Tax=Didymodactylos carnosus TaxID=1234261 RepID=A0A815DUH2_9BILA|nr:unnamed protein product [Didymodactylos carnosus]CAF0859858.1 unnamed protein product [Didymodactylos carnosus]CAF1302862.1 unnamed protein product [Didymodactylos carnosus]CAF3644790.1 unnamed protein product [Didymodactylos carnosus]CAF3644808.1 unnamed protein product [Didymodactylos carnosus]